uniref:Uncharacterized protein n=1 Tax=Heterorhabditis bacteriophora TaxID=37862 RepID=A0A1I7W6F5_HETBA
MAQWTDPSRTFLIQEVRARKSMLFTCGTRPIVRRFIWSAGDPINMIFVLPYFRRGHSLSVEKLKRHFCSQITMGYGRKFFLFSNNFD